MTNAATSTAAGGAVLACALLVAGCGGQAADTHHRTHAGHAQRATAASPTHSYSNPAHKLVFEITGGGRISSLTYTVNGDTVSKTSVDLPWKLTVRIPPRNGTDTWSLKDSGSGSGAFYEKVYADGRLFTQSWCTGDGCHDNLSGSIKPPR